MEISKNRNEKDIFLHPVDQIYEHKFLDLSFNSIHSEDTELSSKYNSKYGYRNIELYEYNHCLSIANKTRFRSRNLKISNFLDSKFNERIIMHKYKTDIKFRIFLKFMLTSNIKCVIHEKSLF